MEDFCDIYHLKSLIKDPTCFKNLSIPSCIDPFLTNCSIRFQDRQAVETGPLYFIGTIRPFDSKKFRTKLENELI